MSLSDRVRRSWMGCAAGAVALALLAGGCTNWTPVAPPPPPAPPVKAPDNLDPCANQLDELCGRLMLYYIEHRSLPPRLEALGTFASPLHTKTMICPVSGEPYVYDPAGVRVIGMTGRLIVYDSKACHYGLRTGILAERLEPGHSLCKVVRVSDEKIIWVEPPAGPPPATPAASPAPAAP